MSEKQLYLDGMNNDGENSVKHNQYSSLISDKGQRVHMET